ncbi:hypothetical protein [Brevibacillus choshinensis]|uniref:Uncharacterized protein n=1 Tax=Brevibacillus choshinensis TaxID=54911 RepID=A0ABX7FYH1_BRECH|nr:hypothetical protein [Brevibacillus choshinensis]QRG70865.1 hypothetical protein JNE38_06495 [Brevibacillus choshinensis]
MKKAAGIALMVALLGFNAYLWPTLIKEVKADQKNEAGVRPDVISHVPHAGAFFLRKSGQI